MQVFTIFNEKGGVGKTTLSGLIGSGLALRGKRVLLIDADGQGDLTTNFNIRKSAGFFRFAKWGDSSNPDFVETRKIIVKVPQDSCPDNLYIVPGNNDTWGIAGSSSLPQLVGSFRSRFDFLQKIFDYIIIDTQPSATMLHEAIGLVTDHFICPTDAEPLSAYGGLRSTVKHISHIREQALNRGFNRANLAGIIPNKYRMNTSLHQHVYEKLIEQFGDVVWEPMPLRTAIPEAQYMQTTLMHDAPDLGINDHIWSLINRVEAIEEMA